MIDLSIAGSGDEAEPADGKTAHDLPANGGSPPYSQAEAGGDYNQLPYPSMPFTDTQPAHLAALATLFGIVAPDIGCARVLELGCAAGGNIIPLAARFPQASFTGIDLSRRHIDDGGKRIAALALTNVKLQQADLTTLDLAGQQFDYIICNGVFSWVPKPTQEAIFRLCRQTLALNGVGTISYNVFPGWHLRMVIRDLCLHYAGTKGTPQHRVTRARAALKQIAEASNEAEPYGALLRNEAHRLKDVPASYILGEFLAADNTPCTIEDFIKHAAKYGLDYLCEVDLCAAIPVTLDRSARTRLTSFASTDRPALEQHIDFLTGRLFRRSVLVRQPAAAGPQRIPSPGRLGMLHISSPVRLDTAQSTDRLTVLTDDRARPITIREPVIGQAIARLGEAFPATLTLDELTAFPGRDLNASAEIEARIRQAVFAMVLAGRASISILPLQVGRAADERPKAWSLARMEAASGQPWITSLRHVGVPAPPIVRALLPHLDGVQDRLTLRALLVAALQSGAVQVPELPAGQPLPSHERLSAMIEIHFENALQYLARHALLELNMGPVD